MKMKYFKKIIKYMFLPILAVVIFFNCTKAFGGDLLDYQSSQTNCDVTIRDSSSNSNTNSLLGEISASLNKEQTYSIITARSSDIEGQEVKLAVWNAQAGQSRSLKWCSMYNSYNQVKFGITIKDFGYAGKYLCDAYLVDRGNMKFLGRTDFNVSELSGSTPTVTDEDKSQLTFKANETNIQSCSGVTSIRFAIWSKTNGQDDLVWTNGPVTPAETGMYSSTITEYLSKHKYQNDTYYIHVYATGNNGVDSCVGTLSKDINIIENSVTASLKSDETISTITATSPLMRGQEVRLAVWNVNAGQALSLKWCPMFNCWSSVNFGVTISDFRYSGQYFCDAYLVNGGDMVFLGRAAFVVSQLTADIPVISDLDKANLSFRVNVTNILSKSKISNCKVAAWSEKGGQDDLKWTNAKISEKGDSYFDAYSVISITDHHYENGIYHIYVYATGKNGVQNCVGTITEDIQLLETGFKTSVNENETLAHTILIDNTLLQNGQLQFAAWSVVQQQRDLKWYDINIDGNVGIYDIPISDFKQLGQYIVDAYFTNSLGVKKCLGRVTFKIEAPTLDARITNIDGHTGSYKVEIFSITKMETISDFTTPSWFDSYGTSTAIWYKAVKQTDSTFTTKPYVSDHKFAFGAYSTHVYANMYNGCKLNLKQLHTEIQPDNYLGIARLDISTYRLCAKGITGQVSKVNFPTWSVGGQQEDIIWYSAHKESDNGWYADFNAKKHWPSGLFFTDCYAYNAAGTERFVTRLQYEIPKEATDISGNIQLDMIIKNIIRTYPTLADCFNYVSHSFAYRSGDVWPGGEWTIPYAIEMATVGSGNCYRFAALFLWCARGLGYSANAISGQVPATRGGLTPHGWVEVYLNGQTYVCDPDLEHELPGYNWYMTTYADAPVEYYK